MIVAGLEFEEVGECSLDDELGSGVRFNLSKSKKDRVIYAFKVNGTVKYAGACQKSKTILKNRMEKYKNMTGESTNKRISEKINKVLREGKKVKILAWKPTETITHSSGLNIDLVNGLENAVIKKESPEWNILR